MAQTNPTNAHFLKVQRKPCATCIYGPNPGTRRSLASLEHEIADPHMPGFFRSYRICHHSTDAVCAGFWRRHKNNFALGQLAQRLKWVRYVTIDLLGRKKRP